MKVLLLGYFAQDNFGDDIHTDASIKLLTSKYDTDIEIYACNQGRGTSPRWDGEIARSIEEMAPSARSLQVREVWFDSISDDHYDLVVTCNGGFPMGISIDVVMMAIDRGIPTEHHCIKKPNPGGVCGETLTTLFNASSFTNFRFAKHHSTYDVSNPKCVAGIDLAFTLDPMDFETSNYIAIAPRFSGDNNWNEAQISYIKALSDSVDEDIVIVPCSYQDLQIIDNGHMPYGVAIPLREKLKFPYRIRRLFGEASMVMSLGRLHAAIVPILDGVPTAIVDLNGPSSHMEKLWLLNDEFDTPILQPSDDITHVSMPPAKKWKSRLDSTIKTFRASAR